MPCFLSTTKETAEKYHLRIDTTFCASIGCEVASLKGCGELSNQANINAAIQAGAKRTIVGCSTCQPVIDPAEQYKYVRGRLNMTCARVIISE